MVYKGNAWLGYECLFRQLAAGNPDAQWSKIDTDLWHLLFTGAVKISRRIKSYHNSYQCNWTPESPDTL